MQKPFTKVLIAAALAAATGAGAQEPNFGRALVLTGDELFVGQPVNWYGPGVVYAYALDGSGAWTERARLIASDSSRMDDFGRALAHDGNTLIVGAPRKNEGSGIAYVFERTGRDAAWRQTGVIAPPATGDHSEFAVALGLAGDELLVGAPAVNGTGAIYQYRRSASGWTQQALIRPPADAALARFGQTLSMDGEWLVVGAPASDSARGRVYIARRQAGGGWGEPRQVNLGPALAPGTRAGSAVLVDGERAYIGMPGGARVLVTERSAEDQWQAVADLQPFTVERGSAFGHTVALAGDEIWVGAPQANRGNGVAYRFVLDERGRVGSAFRVEADSADGTHWPFAFGYSIAADAERAVIGMPQRDFGEGRVLAVTRDAGTWHPRQLIEGQIYAIGSMATPAARCEEGRIGHFTCSNVELIAHMPVSALGGERGVWVNDVWGWTDPQSRRDYALVARRDGASFVDVTDPSRPQLIGNLPRTKGSPPSVWRDIKVIGDHAFIVADGADAHGMQVFDLKRLRAVADTPFTFSPDTTYHDIHSAHNVVADTASGFLYVVGANSGGESCGGGLHMVDARDPLNPVFAGCYNDRSGTNPRGYTHDAQCIVYDGPDTRYRGRQICIGSNESEINIADVTDKANPVLIGRNSYPNVSYAHQGWFDDEQRYFYMNDEGDELDGVVAGTRTIVWDLTELDDPVVAHEYIGPVRASDHNLFVKGDRVYESNYGSGLRVLDISDRTNPREIAFFDSAPYNDDGPGHSAAQSGAWSNYPFFESGIVVFTSVREGLFIVRVPTGRPIS